ncbi:hypothetical protein Niako_0051 [Niastella koreensis GR20-10]|uniref:Uncharacterized protein n=1 Tax=Niastella koreensis (strain DSM 17620 / KACC 11465 / NBRC 106392 / GR20-10) TaxID=700598 RepID=G8TIV9_NIAKG|nr:hypothetical protein [Niastella koreensis]AEV96453.1 hypothetical protein Niako_0051 [Niastella koreensis GR20-10]
MMNYRSLFFNIIVIVASFNAIAQEKLAAQTALKPVAFSVKPSQGYTFRLTNPCYPFHGNKNSIVRTAPALAELTGACIEILNPSSMSLYQITWLPQMATTQNHHLLCHIVFPAISQVRS